MVPYTVLDIYIPPSWNVNRIGRDLLAISYSHGLEPLPIGSHRMHKGRWAKLGDHADIVRRSPSGGEDSQWHQDGDITGANLDCGLVLWASNTPTQFKYKGEIYQPNKWEVVIARNSACMHRRPPNVMRRRWLFRQRVCVPSWL